VEASHRIEKLKMDVQVLCDEEVLSTVRCNISSDIIPNVQAELSKSADALRPAIEYLESTSVRMIAKDADPNARTRRDRPEAPGAVKAGIEDASVFLSVDGAALHGFGRTQAGSRPVRRAHLKDPVEHRSSDAAEHSRKAPAVARILWAPKKSTALAGNLLVAAKTGAASRMLAGEALDGNVSRANLDETESQTGLKSFEKFQAHLQSLWGRGKTASTAIRSKFALSIVTTRFYNKMGSGIIT
jgi:hypothetical protein